MWGLFVGIAIGILQVLALNILGKMILGDNAAAKMLGALLLMAKIAVIVFIFYLISTVSLTHVIWTAGGLFAGLIAALAFLSKRKKTH